MSEKTGERVRVGDYELGERYQEVGPELGKLYEARSVLTGKPALVLLPGEGSKWKLSGPWSVRLAYDPGAPPPAWRLLASRALLFLVFVGLGLAVGCALRQVGWL